MNRVDVVEPVVDLVNVDLADIGLVNIDIEVDNEIDRIRQACSRLLSFEKCCRMQ